MITAPEVRGRGVRALGLGAVSVLVLAVACEMPPPVGVADDEPPTPGALETLAAARAMTCEPGVVIDGARMAGSEALDALDPADIASIDLFLPADAPAAGACGLVLVLTADAAPGVAELTRMLRDAFGVAADRQAGDEPAPQEARTRSTRLENPGPPQTRSGTDRVEDGPTFTPMTVRPTLTNVDEVRRAFDQHYPPLLRGAGITGTAQVWLFIDADGVVRQTRLRQSAGHDALDQAALRVARTMVFTPARYQGAPVAVWIALPVRFASKATGPRSTGTR